MEVRPAALTGDDRHDMPLLMSQHGGNIRALAERAQIPPEQILDFSASINPLGPPRWLGQAISSQIGNLVHYPDCECRELKAAVAQKYSVEPAEVVAGNGSTELLYLLPQLVKARRAIIPVPSYVDYAKAARLAGVQIVELPAKEDQGFTVESCHWAEVLQPGDMVLIGRPNNPTGAVCDQQWLSQLIANHPDVTFVVDEAFGELAQEFIPLLQPREPVPPNVVVLISLTKSFAVPGLRLGVALASSDLASRMAQRLPPWSVNTLAQAVGVRAMQDTAYPEESRRYITQQRQRLADGLAELGFTVFPGQANYLLVKSHTQVCGLAEQLLKSGIAIRICDNFVGLDSRCFRVAVRTASENERLLQTMARIRKPTIG
jgi:L-threonine-O-3-phosphate decarboxylase